MKLIVWITLFFIAYELFKLIFARRYWYASLERINHKTLAIVEISYLIYLVSLFFIGYWYIGTLVLIVSLVTAFQIMDDAMEQTKFNDKIRNYLLADGVVSILVLLILIVKELKK